MTSARGKQGRTLTDVPLVAHLQDEGLLKIPPGQKSACGLSNPGPRPCCCFLHPDPLDMISNKEKINAKMKYKCKGLTLSYHTPNEMRTLLFMTLARN